MRALCGAIITAGALIGLGLLGIGFGNRYAAYATLNQEGKPQWVVIDHMDTALLVSLGVLLACVVIGLGIAFMGLAYHHHRRHHELLHLQRQMGPPGTTGLPPERVGS